MKVQKRIERRISSPSEGFENLNKCPLVKADEKITGIRRDIAGVCEIPIEEQWLHGLVCDFSHGLNSVNDCEQKCSS